MEAKYLNPEYVICDNGDLFPIKTGINLVSYLKDNALVYSYKDQEKIKTIRVKLLVANSFIPNPFNLKYVINIDGNIHNNDVSNLTWSLNKNKSVFYNGIEKECSTCGFVKSIFDFPHRNNRKIKTQPYCISCAVKSNRESNLLNPEKKKDYHYKRTYNITIDQYNSILESQDNKCAICFKSKDKMCLDHCHSTGRIRGILCDSCNRSIGLLKEDKNVLYNAIKYLTKWQ
jgi:hypothetical protein